MHRLGPILNKHRISLATFRNAVYTASSSSSSSSSSRGAGSRSTGSRTFLTSAVTASWMGRLFNKVPKGFGKFYPPGSSSSGASSSTSGSSSSSSSSSSSGSTSAGSAAGKASQNAGEAAAKSTKRTTGSGGSGSGGGGGGGGGGNKKNGWNSSNGPSPTESRIAAGLLLAALAAAAMMSSDSKPGKEISWQEFQSQLLESGQVDRIIVSNKATARVVLRTPEAHGLHASDGSGGPASYGTSPSPSSSFPGSSSYDAFDTGSGVGAGGADGTHAVPASPSKFIRYPRIGSPSAGLAPYHFAIGSVESFERKLEEAQRALNIHPRDFVPVVYVDETDWTHEAARFLPTLVLIGLYVLFMRSAAGGGSGMRGGPGDIFKIGQSTAKKINKETVTTTFADVAGCDEAKREVMEFVQFLKDSKKFTDLGAKIPKGALLCGPPGTGKTLLAKATAGESNVPFFSISGSDFVEMFVGVGPSRVRDLFKEARANAPCIIFIDEIDAIGRQRGKGGFGGSNDERESTLNQLLVEMDGFDASTNIVVLAGTNRVDILDSALTRPGRFDRQIQVDKPDIQGRKQIFDVYLRGITLDGEVGQYSARLAALTPGFTGADIANICNEAAIIAARRDKTKVDIRDFETATERVIGGLESKKLMSPEERRVVAYHEAGHAIAGWNLEHADPLLKVTIVPRGSGALGFAQYLPKEIFLRTREQILDMVCMALAGRAAEQITFGRVTTGAADDLRRVTQIVYQMVQVYGMNDKIGQVSFPREEGQWPQEKMYSNATSEVMDAEVRNIVDEAYRRTLALIEEKKDQVRLVAELLLEKETITNTDVAKLIGRRPHGGNKEYEMYASSGWDVPAEGPEGARPTGAEGTKEANGSSSGSGGSAALSPAFMEGKVDDPWYKPGNSL